MGMMNSERNNPNDIKERSSKNSIILFVAQLLLKYFTIFNQNWVNRHKILKIAGFFSSFFYALYGKISISPKNTVCFENS
jgi:hypothetical protein